MQQVSQEPPVLGEIQGPAGTPECLDPKVHQDRLGFRDLRVFQALQVQSAPAGLQGQLEIQGHLDKRVNQEETEVQVPLDQPVLQEHLDQPDPMVPVDCLDQPEHLEQRVEQGLRVKLEPLDSQEHREIRAPLERLGLRVPLVRLVRLEPLDHSVPRASPDQQVPLGK